AVSAADYPNNFRIAYQVRDPWIGSATALHNKPPRELEVPGDDDRNIFDIFFRDVDADDAVQSGKSLSVTGDENLVGPGRYAGQIEQTLNVRLHGRNREVR